MRPLSIKFEKLDRVDGSAQFGFGDTKAIASVSGPIEVRLAAEQPSKATFEVSVLPSYGIPGTESKALAANIRNILSPVFIFTQNPRSLIQLIIQSLTPHQSVQQRQLYSPSLIAACINAGMLALLNASSFPLRGVVCAVAVGIVPTSSFDQELVLDPPNYVLAGGCFAFSFAGDEEEVVWVHWNSGGLSASKEASLENAKALAETGARKVYAAIKEAVTPWVNSKREDKMDLE